MAKKRKLPSKSTDSTSTTTTTTTTPPQKQQPPKKIPKKTQQQNDKQQQEEQEAAKKQQLQQQQEITQQQEDEEEEDVEEEEEEYEEIEEEFEEEEQQQQEDEEDDEEDDDVEEQKGEETIVEDDEPIPDLLDPFTKDQLMMILREAAEIHPDVASRIRKVADEDTIHRKIFVHGLGWDTTTETLKSAFTEYGDIEDCKAVTDKVSGKSKGYGFILFKTRSGAKKALKEPQKRIGGRMTACQLAAVGPGAPVGFGVGGGGGSGGMQGGGGPVSEYTQRKIYVSNVASEIDPGKLTAFFSRFGEIEEGPLGLDKKTGKPKGFCLFVYKSVESAKKALEEPHKKFEGCVLHCQKAIDGPKPGKQQMGHGHGHGHGPGQGRGKHFGGRGGNSSMGGGMGGGPGGGSGMMGQNVGFNQGAVGAPAPGLNPALGQALTALLASQGAGLGLNNLLGTLGGGGGGGGYGGQSVGVSPSVLGGYGAQGGLQSAYPNQQMGQGGSGRSQHGHMGGGYAGH